MAVTSTTVADAAAATAFISLMVPGDEHIIMYKDGLTTHFILARYDDGFGGVLQQGSSSIIDATVDGGQMNGTTMELTAGGVIVDTITDVASATSVGLKVDKVAGSGLLETTAKNKLSSLATIKSVSTGLALDGAGALTSTAVNKTDAEIKTAYENNADTNALTDAANTKLTDLATIKSVSTGLALDGAGALTSTAVNKTDAEIKTAYENNADTNALTDAANTKLTDLATIKSVSTGLVLDAAGALTATAAGMTDAEIKTAYENNADTNVLTDTDKAAVGIVWNKADSNAVVSAARSFNDIIGEGRIELFANGPGTPTVLTIPKEFMASALDHTFEPILPSHGTAYNKNFGTITGTVGDGGILEGKVDALTAAHNNPDGFLVLGPDGKVPPELYDNGASGITGVDLGVGANVELATNGANAIVKESEGNPSQLTSTIMIGENVNISRNNRHYGSTLSGVLLNSKAFTSDIYENWLAKAVNVDTIYTALKTQYDSFISPDIVIGVNVGGSESLKKNVAIGNSVSIGQWNGTTSDKQTIFNGKTVSDYRNVFLGTNVKVLKNTHIDGDMLLLNGSFETHSNGYVSGAYTRKFGDLEKDTYKGHKPIYSDEMLTIGFYGGGGQLSLAGNWQNGDTKRTYNIFYGINADVSLVGGSTGISTVGTFECKHRSQGNIPSEAYWLVDKLKCSYGKKAYTKELSKVTGLESFRVTYDIYQTGITQERYRYNIKLRYSSYGKVCTYELTRHGVTADS